MSDEPLDCPRVSRTHCTSGIGWASTGSDRDTVFGRKLPELRGRRVLRGRMTHRG